MPPRSRDALRLPLLAGWLFADLMLLLFIVGLSFAPTQTSTVAAKPSPSPTVHATPPGIPKQRVLQHNYYTIYVNVQLPSLQSGNLDSAVANQLINGTNAQLRTLVAQNPSLQGKAVGVAVIFGAGPQSEIGAAMSEASDAGSILHAKDPAFEQAAFLPEWTGSQASTYVELIMFFYAS
jgi:hypothetical protein